MATEAQQLIIIRDQFALKGLSNQVLATILPSYKDAISRITKQLEKLPEGAIERQLYLKKQLATFVKQFEATAAQLYQALPKAQAEGFEQSLKRAEQYLAAGGIEARPSSAPKAPPEVDQFLAPTVTKQQIIAASKTDGFSQFSPGGTTYGLDQLLPEWQQAQAKEIERHLRTGFLMGRSSEEIAREIGPLGPGRKGWAMTDAMVRTGMAEASQAAHDSFYQANEEIIPKAPGGYSWWWDASNDSRLCRLCAPLDNVKFKERSNPPAPWPRHFNCRCKILPFTATMAELEKDETQPPGSFLESTPVKYIKGKRQPPPKGYESVADGGTAYKQPRKIDGEMFWVRRRALPEGKNTAGDFLQKANATTKEHVFGTKKDAALFDALTRKGGRFENDPQGAVRKVLGDPLPPGAQPPTPQPKPPTPTPTQAQLLRQRGDQLIKAVAPAIDANESIRRRAQTVLAARTKALTEAKTDLEKEAARAAYTKAIAIVNRSDMKAKKAMDKLFEAMKQTPMTDQEVKSTVDRIDLKQWGTKRDLKKQVKSDVADFVRMFNGKGFTATENGVPWIQEIAPDVSGRGYNQGGKFIAVRVQNTGNLWHEMMHTVESQRPWMLEAAKEWAASRADDLPLTDKMLKLRGVAVGTRRDKPVFSLADIVPGSDYKKGEIGWNDDYLNPYMGKVYDSNDATEVWTMAVETIVSGRAGMLKLHSKHPDLFRMLVGLSQTN